MPDVFVAPEEQKPLPAKRPSSPVAKETKPEPVDPGQIKVKKQKIGLLTSYCPFPEGVQFENQEDGEEIHLFLRRHIITNVRWILTAIGLTLLPFITLLLLSSANLSLGDIPGRYITIFLLFYYLIIFGYIYVNFTIWFYNIGLVTQLRVVDLDITHISHKNVAATGIADIVDVEYTQGGFLHNFFNYGNVNMQTEGVKPNFEFHSVSHPAKVTDVIHDLMREVHKNE